MTKIYIKLYEIDNLDVPRTPDTLLLYNLKRKRYTPKQIVPLARMWQAHICQFMVVEWLFLPVHYTVRLQFWLLLVSRHSWVTAWGQGGKFRFWRVPVNIGIYAEAQRQFSTIEPSLLLYFYSLVFPQFCVRSFDILSQTFLCTSKISDLNK
jgi:hypothetical protein